MTKTATPVKIAILPVDHFAGARYTRRTFAAAVVFDDESETRCGHANHKTVDAAIACGRRLWKRATP